MSTRRSLVSCDPDMQSQIQKILQKGHGSFKVLEFTGFLDIWEPATLAIKRGAYSIRRSSEPSVVVAENFSPNTIVSNFQYLLEVLRIS
ncbi:hypothetical protein M0R45_015060 [Rubus argutus]|uniref:DUF7046 domain-containing protein n=1 Tax=Rubus argutus TaxID=59490 RepID=A0AAW1XPE5_RUBAR